MFTTKEILEEFAERASSEWLPPVYEDDRRYRNRKHSRLGFNSMENIHLKEHNRRLAKKRRKLTDEQVKAVRALGDTLSNKVLGRMMGVSSTTIFSLLSGKTYKDVK